MSTAGPILPVPLRIKDCAAIVPKQAGNGLAWKNDREARYQQV
jgi:hypothetical protein